MSKTINAIKGNYVINLDYSQLDLLSFIVEVTINRQLNFIAQHNKMIYELDEKLAVLQKEISTGKKSFFQNPKVKYEELSKKRRELVKLLFEPERDLTTARELYIKVLEERERISPGDKELYKKEGLFEDREQIHLYGPYKDYFKIEHHIY